MGKFSRIVDSLIGSPPAMRDTTHLPDRGPKTCPTCAELRMERDKALADFNALHNTLVKENASLSTELDRLCTCNAELEEQDQRLWKAVEWALIYMDQNPDTLDAEFVKVFRRRAGMERK